MYIKNLEFSDEETLQEMLFDFSLGAPTQVIRDLQEQIERDLSTNEAYLEYHASLVDEEDRLELETEERLIRLAEALMHRYESFKTSRQKLYGIRGGNEELLYEVDLV